MQFLQGLLVDSCSHRFTWPRLGGNGQHYQICLVCGTAYQYDWKRMHRTDRLLVTNGQHALASTQTRLPGGCQLIDENRRGVEKLSPERFLRAKRRPSYDNRPCRTLERRPGSEVAEADLRLS
jgi:hypothetical protein